MNANMKTQQNKEYDIILVSAEPYVDHPFFGTGILKRVLEDKGYSVAIIETPDHKKDDDFLKYGKPKLFFGVTSGAMDSMVFNYTPLKKKRSDDLKHSPPYTMPDRAVIVYCNMIRKLFKESKIVIGGIEGSLRRFAHYDFWDNKVRKPILFDSRADILVYGYGELQLLEIAKRLKNNNSIEGINGTCILSKEIPQNHHFIELPSVKDVTTNKMKYCQMQSMFSVKKNLAQEFNNWYILQYKEKKYTSKDLDYIYGLNYSRKIPSSYRAFSIVKNSVLTHRGCFGNCYFCSIAQNTGNEIVSRSKKSILDEIRKIASQANFNGIIELSGASANMYGMDCEISCSNNCLKCKNLDKSHSKIIDLLSSARKITNVKKILIRSGVRYDLAIESEEYLKEIIKHHTEDILMIAPEHTNKDVLKAMNKNQNPKKFMELFNKIANEENIKIELAHYLMVGHPGCTINNSKELNEFVKKHKNTDSVQLFTPTPMTISTSMYYTGMNPFTFENIYVPYTYNEKKKQKNIAMGRKSNKR